MVRRPRLGLL